MSMRIRGIDLGRVWSVCCLAGWLERSGVGRDGEGRRKLISGWVLPPDMTHRCPPFASGPTLATLLVIRGMEMGRGEARDEDEAVVDSTEPFARGGLRAPV